MGKYTNDAKELLHLVGGRENIAAVSHCITRMRFVLNDPKKADIQKIEAMKVVKGSFTQAGHPCTDGIFPSVTGNTGVLAGAGRSVCNLFGWLFRSL